MIYVYSHVASGCFAELTEEEVNEMPKKAAFATTHTNLVS